jgi:DNA-binding transcriptional ArsR family regulator
MNADEALARARILKAMSHPVRLTIVDELSRGDRCVCELLPLVTVDQSVLSRHLAQLKHAGIVTERRDGTRVFHHLECPCILDALDCTLGVLKADAKRRQRAMRGEVRRS